jgi:SAM-dependent methyltransferase
MTALDIGCGRGELIMYASLEMGVTGLGIDYASAGLERGAKCLEFFSESDRKHILLCRADATALPFRTGTCDRIMSWATLEHLFPWQLELMLSECSRLLKRDGIMVLGTHPTSWYERGGYRLNRIARSLVGDHTLLPYEEMKADGVEHVHTLSPIELLHSLHSHGFYSVLRFEPRTKLGINSKVLRVTAKLLERLPVVKAFFCAEIVTISAKNRQHLREHLATLKAGP